MAKFKSPLGVMSGKLGALVFADTKGGNIVRLVPSSTFKGTARQLAVNAALAAVSSEWQALTDGEREQWASYASTHPVTSATGTVRHLSAHQWYVAINGRLRDVGSDVVALPPAGAAPAALLSATGAIVGGALTGTLTYTGTVPDGGWIRIAATPPGSPGRDPNAGQSRVWGYSDEDPTSPVTFPVKTTMIHTQKTNLYVSVLSPDGLLSPPIKVTIIASDPGP